MNSFVWVSKKQIGALGGARFSLSAILSIGKQLDQCTRFRVEPSPTGRVSVGAKYFKELLNRSTFQEYSVQISGTINF
jgi:hypothetical protein